MIVGELGPREVVIVIVGRLVWPSAEKFMVAKFQVNRLIQL